MIFRAINNTCEKGYLMINASQSACIETEVFDLKALFLGALVLWIIWLMMSGHEEYNRIKKNGQL